MLRMARAWCLLLTAAGAAWLVLGCRSPSYDQPAYQNANQPTVRSSAWPAQPGQEAHGARLDVQPKEATNPVRTQHVLIATLLDDTGAPRHGGKVEWMLEGAGHIVEVDDEGGLFSRGGGKVNDKYAISYTASADRRISRGTGNPADDFVIHAGQTWCVITSATEGDSNLTIYAPEITNWNLHKVYAVKHWIDAEWTLPPPAVNRVGTEHQFTTRLFRHTDREPLANYKVRYRILDGPPAVLVPGRGQEAIATSDIDGQATVKLIQVSPMAGINRIGIDIIRRPDPLATSGVGIVIGKGETTKEWQAPQITLAKAGPTTAPVNGEIPYSITIANVGKVESREMTVHDLLPDGLAYLRSDPAAIVDGTQLTWTLPGLPAAGSHVLHVYCKATKVTTVTNTATVATADGLKAENRVTTQITEPQLTVAKTAPAEGVVGVPVTYTITVTNPGSGSATNVVLHDEFDKDGLEHESKANPVELRLGELAAGQSRTVTLNLMPKKPGTFMSMVTATADGALKATAQRPVTIHLAKLTLAMIGPHARYADRPAKFDITVTNDGEAPLNNVVVRDVVPRELDLVKASDSGQPTPATVSSPALIQWTLGTLKPGEKRTVTLETRCVTMSPRVQNVVTASADPGQQAQASTIMEIRGLPAYRLEVTDSDDPISVGGQTTYHIDVTNQGSLPGNGIDVQAYVPNEMRIITAQGPSAPKYDSQHITFAPVDALPPKQALHYTITVQPIKPGDLRFRIELRSATLKQPVVQEESTTVIDPNTPPPAAGTAEPPK